MPDQAVVKMPTQHKLLPFGAAVMRIVSPAAHTGGAFGMVEYFSGAAVQSEPPMMTHTHEDWTCWVLAGVLNVRLPDREVMVPTNGSITVPRGTPFAWWTRYPQPLRLILVFSPGGVEQFFADVLDGAKALGVEPDQEKLTAKVAELQAKYGIVPG